MGERSLAARMISWVRSLVAVMWQDTWRGCSLRSPRNENTGTRLVARLHLQAGVVDAATVDARRRAGLEPAHAQRQRAQLLGEPVRRRIARPPARLLLEPDVDAAAEEGADRQHHGARGELDARLRDHARHPAAVEQQVGDFLLEQRQVRLVLEQAADGALVELAVGLGARRPHRRALAGVQGAELDPARSMARAMAPPSASISLTRWPLPMPPIAGLQLIWPSASMLCVTSSVRQPMRAAASAASVPA
jgi:hypothetical protein